MVLCRGCDMLPSGVEEEEVVEMVMLRSWWAAMQMDGGETVVMYIAWRSGVEIFCTGYSRVELD